MRLGTYSYLVDYIVTYVTCPYKMPGVWLQFWLTKARPRSYLMNKSVDSKIVFKFLDAQLLVRRVRPNPAILLTHNSTLKKRGSLARYNLTRVELKTFTFAAGSKSLSIDNAVIGTNFSFTTSAIFRSL